MKRSNERERVRMLRELFAGAAPGVALGIGDDAALLSRPREDLAWSIDAAVEGVHFRRDWMSLEDVGYRATMAALSDLAAMSATPLAVLAALTLPTATDDAELAAIARGQRAAAVELDAPIVGGNLARGDVLTITTTVLGEVARGAQRSGARAGDLVAAAGELGFAGAGRMWLERGLSTDVFEARGALAAFRRPIARIAAGRDAARSGVTSMIDVSDGLATDAAQLAEASSVTIELDLVRVVDDELARLATSLGSEALELALSGGEDYALLATFPPSLPLPKSFRLLGRVTAKGEAAVLVVDAHGDRRPVSLAGFDHFR